ncbi:MAG TPA: hypothetical protein VN947_35975 [Polyangia bacterium]|nr:hypothetical protein [Polyangia bacterium]
MPRSAVRKASVFHRKGTLLPSLLLTLTPLLDIVRILTHDAVWARLAFWFAVLGVCVAALTIVPELVDWLTADRGSRARTDGTAPLLLHLAALWPLALGVVDRIEIARAVRAAAAAELPSITRLDAWPMALAIAGALAFVLAAWMREERRPPRVRRYQPTGLPSRA